MKVYTDTDENTAIVICNAEELATIEHGLFFGAEHFRKLAESENEDWKRDLDFQIAIKYAENHDKIVKHRVKMFKAIDKTKED